MTINTNALDGLGARVLQTGMAPAAAVVVTDRERTLVSCTYGEASPGAQWPIASIGKSFTAVIALQLVEEGLLDLDAAVTHYVPWLAPRSRFGPITVHHLLTHSAGVIESSDLAPASNYDVLALADTETGFAPGSHRHYSNVGYRAVGVVLETVTGRPYEELVQQRVLDRLGMHGSSAVMRHDTRRLLAGGNVPFYDDRPWQREHGLAPAAWVESAEADGCLCCSAEDLATYLRALWAESELLSALSFAAMKRAHPPHGEEDEPYGYGLGIQPDGFFHDGDMLGYVSYMRADTAAGVGAVAFANGFGGAWMLAEGALALATGREPPDPALDHPEPLVDDGSSPPEWRPFLGRFRSHNPWLPTFLIAARGGELVMGTDWVYGSDRESLAPMENAGFRVGEREWSPERMRFDTVVDGLAQRAIFSGTPYYRAFSPGSWTPGTVTS